MMSIYDDILAVLMSHFVFGVARGVYLMAGYRVRHPNCCTLSLQGC